MNESCRLGLVAFRADLAQARRELDVVHLYDGKSVLERVRVRIGGFGGSRTVVFGVVVVIIFVIKVAVSR